MSEQIGARWGNDSEQMLEALRAWREVEATASLEAIEHAVDERLNQMRATLIEELVTAGRAMSEASCPLCGGAGQRRAQTYERQLQGQGGALIKVQRERWECPTCKVGFFPP